jgi:uncharacterized protein (DUF427 family)
MAKRIRQVKQTVNQRRENNVMAKRIRQVKQTVNQRREDNVIAKRKRQDKRLFVLSFSFSHYIVFSSLIYGLFVLSFSFSHCIVYPLIYDFCLPLWYLLVIVM